MERTRSFFEKITELLKKYRLNWTTKKVEHEEFLEIGHGNNKIKLKSNMSKTFKIRSSAVLVSAFLVLIGVGVVDAQTRVYEAFYKGNSIGYVSDPEVLESAVNSIAKEQSGNTNVADNDYETRPARSADCMTAEEVAEVIAETKIQETVQVAKIRSINQTPVTPNVVTPVTEAPLDIPVAEAPVKETSISVASEEEIPVVEAPSVMVTPEEEPVAAEVPEEMPVVEAPAVEVSVPEVPVIEAPIAESPVIETPAAESPVVEAPIVEAPVAEAPVVEAPVAPIVELPVVTPVVETPAEVAPVVETPVVEAPQAKFILPTSGRIGEILRDYDGGYYSNHYRAAAVDILNSAGTSVYAAASGTVTLSSWYGGYGKCVIINHGNGYSTLYGHFSSVDVSEGQTVTQGQRIGGMGSTGSSTANHVHFEVRLNDEAQPISNFFSIHTGDSI